METAEVLVPDSDHSSIETLGSQDIEELVDEIEGPTQNVRRSSRKHKRRHIDVVGGTGRPIKKKK